MSSAGWSTLVAAHEASRDRARVAVPEHAPSAAIVACSDARVPPSVVFDQPAGSLFVVRGAGNTASPTAIASLDYAVSELSVPLIVILGHTNCGAVAAADAGECQGYLAPLTEQICKLAAAHPELSPTELTGRNVQATMAALEASASPVGVAIRSGAVEVVGAVYDLASDDLTPVDLPSYPRPQGGILT